MDMLNNLVCPQCKNFLGKQGSELICNQCSMHWPIKEGIAVFTRVKDSLLHESIDDEFKELLHVAQVDGWEKAFYKFNKALILRGGRVPEDQRMGDWRYLLPPNGNSVVLVLGCGWGVIPFVFSETCAKVYAVDSTWHKIAFLNIRKRQQKINNLFPVYVSRGLRLPFPEKHFDLVVVREFQWAMNYFVEFREIVRHLNGFLKAGGVVNFVVGNRWGLQHLLRQKKNPPSLSLHTFFGYRRALQAEGFTNILFYAPLPHYDGIPLFYVPLESSQSLNFFLRDIFPLFDMVSPEVKQSYALEYKIAKICVRFAPIFRLSGLFKIFAPGFNIIANKSK